MYFVTHWLILAIALGLTSYLLPGVHISGFVALLVASLVRGCLKAVLKPALVLLTLPITVFTLGLFYFILNGILFALGATLVPGFTVAGFGSAFFGAILMGLISLVLSAFTKPRRV